MCWWKASTTLELFSIKKLGFTLCLGHRSVIPLKAQQTLNSKEVWHHVEITKCRPNQTYINKTKSYDSSSTASYVIAWNQITIQESKQYLAWLVSFWLLPFPAPTKSLKEIWWLISLLLYNNDCFWCVMPWKHQALIA